MRVVRRRQLVVVVLMGVRIGKPAAVAGPEAVVRGPHAAWTAIIDSELSACFVRASDGCKKTAMRQNLVMLRRGLVDRRGWRWMVKRWRGSSVVGGVAEMVLGRRGCNGSGSLDCHYPWTGSDHSSDPMCVVRIMTALLALVDAGC